MTLRVLSINVHIVVKPFKYNKAILMNFFYFLDSNYLSSILVLLIHHFLLWKFLCRFLLDAFLPSH